MADQEAVGFWTQIVNALGLGGLVLGFHAAKKTGEVINRVETLEKRSNPATDVADHSARIGILERSLENHVDRLNDIATSVGELKGQGIAAAGERAEILRLLREHVKGGSA